MHEQETARIVVEDYMQTGEITFHLNTKICDIFSMQINFPCSKPTSKLGETGVSLIRGLNCIPGITRVTIRPYSITITKGIAFNWEEIKCNTIELLKACFSCDPTEIYIIKDGQVLTMRKMSFKRTKDVKYYVKNPK